MFFVTCTLLFCRVATLLIFALSVGGKMRDMTAFRDAVRSFALLPAQWSDAAAWLFLGGETLVFLLLGIGGFLLPAGFLLAAVLLALFSSALTLVLLRHLKVNCNCFGNSNRWASPYDLVRNGVLILCAVAGFLASRVAPEALWGFPLAVTLLLALMAATLVVLLLNLTEIIETVRKPFPIEVE